ncbi:MAG: ornithine cyclodeaminase family protein [Ilumatobacteraceae bacterium]
MMHHHITEQQVLDSADLRAVTDELVHAFGDLANEKAATTVRLRATIGKTGASGMAALYPRRNVGGGKLYAYSPTGRALLIAIFDTAGMLLATFDGETITAERTAATTAVAIRRLAPMDATIGVLFGTGRQAIWQVQAMAQEMSLQELRVVGRSAEKTQHLVDWCTTNGINAFATDPRTAVQDADVVVTVTETYEPLFDGNWLKEGALVCGVGSTTAARQELDVMTVKRATLVVSDSAEGALIEAGDLIHAAAEGHFSFDRLVGLDVVVADPQYPLPQEGIRLFESQGLALEDVVGAWHVLHRLGLLGSGGKCQ